MAVLTQELLLHAERCMRHEDVLKKILLAGLNCTFHEWLCVSFAEVIEEMELWKWDDAPGDFWSRLAKAQQQSNISVTWAEQLDRRLASVHTTGKMSWAAATGSIRECKMRIERIGGSRLDTDSDGSRSNDMGADVGGRSSHVKEHFRSKASWIRKYFQLA